MIREVRGDLLRDDAQVLVNPVNTVGVMGKGLALQVKRAYPEVFRVYAAACRAGDVRPGRMHVVELPGGRWVVNFPTKRHWRGSSRLDDVAAGLMDLARLIPALGVRTVAVPPLGCGHGGLPWPDVRDLIRAELGALDADIRLYGPPGEVAPGAPVHERGARTGRPVPPDADPTP